MVSPSDRPERHYEAGMLDWAGRFLLALALQPGLEQVRTKDEPTAMTNPAHSPQSPDLSTHRLRDQAIAALVPFFVDGRTGDQQTAHVVAAGLLDEYKAATPNELQLAAQIIALGWASLACVSASLVESASLEEMLRLQGHGIALDRLSQKATKALQARRKQRARNPDAMASEHTLWDDSAFQLVIGQAAEKLTEANARLAAFTTALAPAPAPAPKLTHLFGEPMTPAVLNRRRQRN
jgi:hypothetical protein